MTGIPLAAPYLDTSADELSFALGLSAHDALAVTEVETTAGLTVELRLLGASHQVFAGPVRETVACLPGGSRRLPETVTEEFPGWVYRFTARVEHHPQTEFARRVAEVRATAQGRADALCGVFPGDADAVTALAMDRGPGVGWRTWHTYPHTGHVVATHTRMEKR
ncbi:DUF2617 family protein [Streptomyces sp. DSM 42041]|uniref:DUF2617 family protein n=1 Tax=Streptomyces hazeniae TaxID=3075538 RepID=A0ABU2NTM1_9ACTN|nr:DUF2617 family protein [Streptomyces sp. DSM 42041]MDT0380324.1 DUF2617 family protein [Streptomyces sp. DSM 42041]